MDHTTTVPIPQARVARHQVLRVLLACGVASSLLYVGSDIVAAMSYAGYSYASQAFSELLAIGAPTRPFMMASANVYNALVIAFAIGVLLASAGVKRSARLTGLMLLVYGMASAIGPYVPMHQRGQVGSLTDTLHIAVTIVQIVAMALFMTFGALSNGRGFRLFSIATIAAIVAFSALSFLYAPAVAASTPTPGLGLVERVGIYATMLWIAVLSVVLLRGPSPSAD